MPPVKKNVKKSRAKDKDGQPRYNWSRLSVPLCEARLTRAQARAAENMNNSLMAQQADAYEDDGMIGKAVVEETIEISAQGPSQHPELGETQGVLIDAEQQIVNDNAQASVDQGEQVDYDEEALCNSRIFLDLVEGLDETEDNAVDDDAQIVEENGPAPTDEQDDEIDIEEEAVCRCRMFKDLIASLDEAEKDEED